MHQRSGAYAVTCGRVLWPPQGPARLVSPDKEDFANPNTEKVAAVAEADRVRVEHPMKKYRGPKRPPNRVRTLWRRIVVALGGSASRGPVAPHQPAHINPLFLSRAQPCPRQNGHLVERHDYSPPIPPAPPLTPPSTAPSSPRPTRSPGSSGPLQQQAHTNGTPRSRPDLTSYHSLNSFAQPPCGHHGTQSSSSLPPLPQPPRELFHGLPPDLISEALGTPRSPRPRRSVSNPGTFPVRRPPARVKDPQPSDAAPRSPRKKPLKWRMPLPESADALDPLNPGSPGSPARASIPGSDFEFQVFANGKSG